MKKILLILIGLLIPVSVFAYTSPGKPTGFVNDFAGILSVQEKQGIESKLVSLDKNTGFQVVVATVTSLGGDTIENYAVKLFEEWGIGDKDLDNGVLILVALNDREVRFETGYGAGGAVTDIQAGNIIRTVIAPDFKEGRYGAGISGAVDALSAIIANSPEAAQYSAGNSAGQGSYKFNWDMNSTFFLFTIIILNILARILGRTKSWWLGGVIGAVIGVVIGFLLGLMLVGIISTIILTILGLIFDFIVSKKPPGSGTGTGGFWPIFLGGGRGGSGGGGGFGGFGGGMSGGGGASGRW
jgi:uncharacterized protein